MRKLKLTVMFVFSLLLLGIIGGTFAYRGYINEFEGGTHGGCHGSSDTEESETGTMTLTIAPSGNLETDEDFVLTAVVNDFMEPWNETDSYDKNMLVGLSGILGDNDEFMRNLDGVIFWTGKVNDSGDVDVHIPYGETVGVPFEFDLIAPSTAGTYTLIVSAIAASNHSDPLHVKHGAYEPFNITYINTNISVTVVAAAGGGGAIPGSLLAITIGSVFVVTTVLILKKRNILKSK